MIAFVYLVSAIFGNDMWLNESVLGYTNGQIACFSTIIAQIFIMTIKYELIGKLKYIQHF